MVTTNIDSSALCADIIKFGDRVEFLIEKKGISKLWLADKLGVTKQALNYLLKHSSKPKYIDELAEIMQANPHWIEFGEGRPFHGDLKHEMRIDVRKLQIHDSKSILSELKGEEKTGDYETIDYVENNRESLIAYRIQN